MATAELNHVVRSAKVSAVMHFELSSLFSPIAIFGSAIVAAFVSILTNYFQVQREKKQWVRQKLFETYDATLKSLFQIIALEQEYNDILSVRHEIENKIKILLEQGIPYEKDEQDIKVRDKHNEILGEFKSIYSDFRKNLNLLSSFYGTNNYSSTALTLSKQLGFFRKIPVGRPNLMDTEILLQCSEKLVKAMQSDSRLQE
jgi:hypothetical protein